MNQDHTTAALPRHIAVIMDGNGRWAKKRGLPRPAGHRAGVKAVRAIVEGCARRGVQVLTLFAFSSENWKRPPEEVGSLMSLFVRALDREIDKMHRNGIQVRFIGDRSALSIQLQQRMQAAEQRTAGNPGMILVIAVAYGGRWDLLQAMRQLAGDCVAGKRLSADLSEADVASHLALHGLPEPDLFIRTGGERRISNFLLWNLAYTELYFCDVLWPEFDDAQLAAALHHFSERERRFGYTSEQLGGNLRAANPTGTG
ncbi:MAG: polyprenyl diphosphate synthase [Steroidobacteraceae bacterium]